MQDIKSKEIKLVDIHTIIPNPKNANRHSIEQIKRLEKLIEYQGFRNPLIVSNRTGFLVVGHGRLEAAKNLGMEKLPVVYQDFKDEAQEYAYLISDNEIARWAELDKQSVYDELKTIELDDIELLGLEDFEIPDIEEIDPQTDEDEVPEVEDPITKRGDVWLLGKHRLMCGDSTMIDDVEKLMNGEKADMVFTDPPYGMKLDADYSKMGNEKIKAGKKHSNIMNDEQKFDASFIFDMFFYCKDIVLFGADYYAESLVGKNEGSWLVWDKRVEEKYDKIIGSAFETIWSKRKVKREIIRYEYVSWSNRMKDTVNGEKPHPTMKPTDMLDVVFNKINSNPLNALDLFGGSGSTLIVCEKRRIPNYTMELDEKYCDVIINRWQNYTGKKATLESSGQTYEELKNGKA